MSKKIDNYMSLPYRMELIPDPVEGGYTAWFPELPGCVTCAETIEGAAANALDAKAAWLTAAIEEGIEIPEPAETPALSTFSGQFKLRIPKSLHRSLTINAKREGISLNQYCVYLLSKNDAAYSPRGYVSD